MGWPQFAVRGAGALAAIMLLVVSVTAGCSPVKPAAASRPAAAVPAAAVPASRPVPTAPEGSFRRGELDAVAAVSARSAWVVGVAGHKTLVERWDGQAWSEVPDRDLAAGSVPLQGVTARSATDAWAVGEISGDDTLVWHWSGRQWQRLPSPTPSSGGDGLTAVAAASGSDAWAVGFAASSSILSTTLIEHWDGRTWKHVPSPAPQPGCGGCQFPGDRLTGVAVTSVTNAWAVGGSGRGALIERWNGARWTWVTGPAAAAPGGSFQAVTARSASNAWAVGSVKGETLTEHWNGRSWTRVPSPSPASALDGNVLTSVAATSPSNAWAAGYTGDHTLMLHWDGKTWTHVPTPSPGSDPEFLGVAATSADCAWAVGFSGDDHTLIAHWDGKTWTRQADRR